MVLQNAAGVLTGLTSLTTYSKCSHLEINRFPISAETTFTSRKPALRSISKKYQQVLPCKAFRHFQEQKNYSFS